MPYNTEYYAPDGSASARVYNTLSAARAAMDAALATGGGLATIEQFGDAVAVLGESPGAFYVITGRNPPPIPPWCL